MRSQLLNVAKRCTHCGERKSFLLRTTSIITRGAMHAFYEAASARAAESYKYILL